jgi:hypothetical protein
LADAASAHRDPESRRADGKLLRATPRHGLSVFIGIDIMWIYASDVPLRTSDDAHPSLRGVTLTMSAAPGDDVTGAVRRHISAVDANLTPFELRGMPEQVDGLMFPVRLAMEIYGAIGLFGLVLAAVGLAGVTAYSVTRHSREIGIRVALGARRGDVPRLVMGEGAVLVAAGTVLRLAGAWGAARGHRRQHLRPGPAGGRPAAGPPGAGRVLPAGAQIHAHRSGGGVAPGTAAP